MYHRLRSWWLGTTAEDERRANERGVRFQLAGMMLHRPDVKAGEITHLTAILSRWVETGELDAAPGSVVKILPQLVSPPPGEGSAA